MAMIFFLGGGEAAAERRRNNAKQPPGRFVRPSLLCSRRPPIPATSPSTTHTQHNTTPQKTTCSQGGLREGLVVELANGASALVVAADEASVRLDANSMLAGKRVVFELELVGLEREH
jgi:hypothetical protein